MTNEEALKRFKWKYNLTKDYNDPHWEGGERREHSEWVEQLEIAVNALEKQTPKKVSVLEMPCENIYSCPNCYKRHIGRENYCSDCGQALDFNSNGSGTE